MLAKIAPPLFIPIILGTARRGEELTPLRALFLNKRRIAQT
jgi:hypothetical protein